MADTFEIHFSSLTAPVACVDIGGTKIAVSVADHQGVRGKVSEPTVKVGDRGAVAAQIIRLIEASCQAGELRAADITAVGVASCGPFVIESGKIELAAPNICGGLAGIARGLPNNWPTAYLEVPLSQVFSRVRVENDGVGALEAERRWGALQGIANCAYVTWSTGIGMGLCVDGRILRGKNGNAGHAGHTFVSDNTEALCGCGNVGDVEGLIAGNAIARRFGSQGYPDASALMVAAQAGDALAMGVVDELCRVMGRTLYNMAATLDLQRISMGGSVFWHHREFLLPKLKQHWQGKFSALTDGLEVVPAGLGMQVGDYAALALVLDAKT